MKKVVFVCLGNICRSPSAEAVFNGIIKKHGLENNIACDSAGTISYHVGESADARMQRHARRRGYTLTSISRQINPAVDFETFDFVIGMDESNIRDLQRLDSDGAYQHKIKKMTEFCQTCDEENVPDPYYGGEAGFERVLDILEDACEGLLKVLDDGHSSKN